MDRHTLTSGGGARTCPDRNLAELIATKVVSVLVRDFEISVSIPPAEQMRIYSMAMLTGARVWFLKRRQAPLQPEQD